MSERKDELVCLVERALISQRNELEILRRGRATEIEKWNRTVMELKQRILERVRSVHTDGIEQLTSAMTRALAKTTKRQVLLKTMLSDIFVADEDNLLKLESEIPGKATSDSTVSLCPEVTLNIEDIIQQFEPKVMIENISVPRPKAVEKDLEQSKFIIFPYSQIESRRWPLPMVVCSHHDKGAELMHQLLRSYRSVDSIETIEPSETKWKYGMVPNKDSFSRVAFRIFNREDETLNNVLVLYLDDAKTFPRWRGLSGSCFYRIPAKYNFHEYPAYTYHVWLTNAAHPWSHYGPVYIPIDKRLKIREFINQFKTYDVNVPDVQCTVCLKETRGKSEPWAIEGDIFLGTTVEEAPELEPDTNRSLGNFISSLFSEETVESEEEAEIIEEAESAAETEKSEMERESAKTPKDSPTDSVEDTEALVILQPKRELLLMDIEEQWRCADNFDGQHEFEDEFWPRGERFRQSAFIIELLKDLDIEDQVKMFTSEEVIDFIRDGLQLVISDEDNLDSRTLAKYLTTEMILWRINGTKQLRLQLIQIQKFAAPQWSSLYDAFGLPCQYIHAHGILNEIRYDRIPRRSTRNGQPEADEDSDDSAFSEMEDAPITRPQMPVFSELFEDESDYCILPKIWPDFSKIETEVENKEDSFSTASIDEETSTTWKTPEIVERETMISPKESNESPPSSPTQSGLSTTTDVELPVLDTWVAQGHANFEAKSKASRVQTKPQNARELSLTKFGVPWPNSKSSYRFDRSKFKSPTPFRAVNPSRGYSGHSPRNRYRFDQDRESKYDNEINSSKWNANSNGRQIFIRNNSRNSQSDWEQYSDKFSRLSKTSSNIHLRSQRRRTTAEYRKPIPQTYNNHHNSCNAYGHSNRTNNASITTTNETKEKPPPPPPKKVNIPPPIVDEHRVSDTEKRGVKLKAPPPPPPPSVTQSRVQQNSFSNLDIKKDSDRRVNRRMSYRGREVFNGDESSNSSQDRPVEYGDTQPGQGTTGCYTAGRETPHIHTPAPAVQVTDLPKPSWKQTKPDRNNNLYALVRGIRHWRKNEVEQLFHFCSPREVMPCGNDWILFFHSKQAMEQSVMIEGTEIKKGSDGPGKIEVEINNSSISVS